MKKLYIIGTGSQARYVIENLKDSDEYKIEGLIDIENSENVGKKINDVLIVGVIKDIAKHVALDSYVIVAYGKNQRKKEIVSLLSEKGYRFATVIGKNSYISNYVEIGEGSIINPNVTIMPNTRVGKHVIIHSGSVIEHDNEIGHYANIAPGVKTGGRVKIEEGSYIYTGAVITPDVRIGKNSIVGAGAVVLEDVSDKITVVGVPAKPIHKK